MKFIWVTGLVAAVCLLLLIRPTTVTGVDVAKDQRDEITPSSWMTAFRPYTGHWASAIKGEASALVDEDYERTTEWQGRFILDGAMFEITGVDDLGGVANEYVWLFGYDDVEKKYVAWYHDEEGIHLKFERIIFNQDEGNKTFSFHLEDDNDFEYRTSMSLKLADPKMLEYSFVMYERETLNIILKEFGKAKRIDESINR